MSLAVSSLKSADVSIFTPVMTILDVPGADPLIPCQDTFYLSKQVFLAGFQEGFHIFL